MEGQERWEGRLEAVNTERTAKKGFVSGGHRCVRVCVCMCMFHLFLLCMSMEKSEKQSFTELRVLCGDVW